MSGRLVILRHKSWNVWNRDNQEKVLRDERLHREEIEEKKLSNKRKISEATYDELSSSKSSSNISKSKNYNSSATMDQSIPEISAKNNNQQLIPDWKLGDGSKELSKNTPWYENPRVTSIQGKSMYNEQDSKKKRQMDPLSQFHNDSSRIESKEENEDNDKQYHHQEDNPSIRETHKNSNVPTHLSTHSTDSQQLLTLQLLREKRLKREKLERKRELLLLAHADAFGR